MTSPLDDARELLAELAELGRLVSDSRVSAEAIGIRLRNTWPLYERAEPVAWRMSSEDGFSFFDDREHAEEYAQRNSVPLTPLYATPPSRSDAVTDTARFLLDRLDEYDPGDDEAERDYHGHVAPAIARLRSALVSPPSEAGREAVAVLENLDALDKQRTPGPWKKTHDNITVPGTRSLVARCDADWSGFTVDMAKASKNARFIVALENAWPKIRAALSRDQGTVAVSSALRQCPICARRVASPCENLAIATSCPLASTGRLP